MIIELVPRLLTVAVLMSVIAIAGCGAGESADRSPSTLPTVSATPSVDLTEDTAKVCFRIVGAVGKGSSTALADSRLLVGGQLTREEYAQRLRTMFTTVAADLRRLGQQAADPALRTAIEQWAARMDEGAAAPDPEDFFTAHYRVILDEVGKTCKLGS